jgi:hypothetical protein
MSVSASEIEKTESAAKAKPPRQYMEEYHLEAVKYYRKTRETDPKKSIRKLESENAFLKSGIWIQPVSATPPQA